LGRLTRKNLLSWLLISTQDCIRVNSQIEDDGSEFRQWGSG
jgi:hypothetical protein